MEEASPAKVSLVVYSTGSVGCQRNHDGETPTCRAARKYAVAVRATWEFRTGAEEGAKVVLRRCMRMPCAECWTCCSGSAPRAHLGDKLQAREMASGIVKLQHSAMHRMALEHGRGCERGCRMAARRLLGTIDWAGMVGSVEGRR